MFLPKSTSRLVLLALALFMINCIQKADSPGLYYENGELNILVGEKYRDFVFKRVTSTARGQIATVDDYTGVNLTYKNESDSVFLQIDALSVIGLKSTPEAVLIVATDKSNSDFSTEITVNVNNP